MNTFCIHTSRKNGHYRISSKAIGHKQQVVLHYVHPIKCAKVYTQA